MGKTSISPPFLSLYSFVISGFNELHSFSDKKTDESMYIFFDNFYYLLIQIPVFVS